MTLSTLAALRAAFEQNEEGPVHPVFLPPNLYDRAKAEGYNMIGYVKQPMGAFHDVELKPGVTVAGSMTGYMTGYGKTMKHRDDRGCSGNCMLGLNGVCVACSEDDTS